MQMQGAQLITFSDFRSSNGLRMEIYPGHWSGYLAVEVGTVSGLFKLKDRQVRVLSIINNEEGNGQVRDFMEWMEHVAAEKGFPLVVICVWNLRMENMLLKNGFKQVGNSADFIKYIR